MKITVSDIIQGIWDNMLELLPNFIGHEPKYKPQKIGSWLVTPKLNESCMIFFEEYASQSSISCDFFFDIYKNVLSWTFLSHLGQDSLYNTRVLLLLRYFLFFIFIIFFLHLFGIKFILLSFKEKSIILQC